MNLNPPTNEAARDAESERRWPRRRTREARPLRRSDGPRRLFCFSILKQATGAVASTRRRDAAVPFYPFTIFALLILLALVFSGCANSPDRVWYLPRIAPRISEKTPRAEYNQTVFDYACKTTGSYFYDATYGGQDFTALCEKYRAQAIAAKNDEGLYKILNDMFAEFGASHIAAIAPEIVRMQKKIHNDAVSMLGFISVKLPGLDTPVVYEVTPGSPAADAGVKRGWLDVGEMIREIPDMAVYEGEVVRHEFRNERDELITVSMTLRAVPTLGARKISQLRPDGVLYLRFDRFDSGAAAWLRDQLKTNASQIRGVVLDLRLNGGGEVRACRRILGEFFPAPIETGTFIDRKKHPVKMWANIDRAGANYRGPLVVLVARMTGSAAEIFASAVQATKRGVIVGSTSTGRTAGAVLMSTDFTLPGGGKLQVPVRDYVTADGERLEGAGVRADVRAPLPTVASLRAGEDAALEIAQTEALRTFQ